MICALLKPAIQAESGRRLPGGNLVTENLYEDLGQNRRIFYVNFEGLTVDC